MRSRLTFGAVLCTAALCLVGLPAQAVNNDLAEVDTGVFQIRWTPNHAYAGFSLVVTGPDGAVRREFAGGDRPLFSLAELEAASDGLYKWELTATPELSRAAVAALSAGGDARDRGLAPRTTTDLPTLMSGHFRVAGGAIVQRDAVEQPARLAPDRAGGAGAASAPLSRETAADQVIPDDLIVQRSLCVGFDCVNGEDFGFDTIRLKENNLRVHFLDTSVGSFPSGDWRLEANSSASGGPSYFAIQDADAARNVLVVEDGAPSNGLVIDSTGRVGLGTSAPVVELHVKSGDSPTLRLEQDTSSGFQAQTWDVAGNESNFFVRDVTGGSLLPFRIRPGAPTSSIDVAASGNVGMGTASPSNSLHLRRTNGTAQLFVEESSGTAAGRVLMNLENNGQVQFRMKNTEAAVPAEWLFTASNAFQIDNLNDVGVEFQINPNGEILQNGAQIHAPDYVFEPDYELRTLDELAAFIAENKHLPNVPSALDIQTNGLNLTQFPMRLLEKIEELALYTLAQEKKLDELAGQNEALGAKNAELEQAIEELKKSM